ncbi:hypothetical protein L249_5170 [Ophiocordyceps polyrhachis-furcata BCC 54312]|uniref:Kinesin motor domain-containing protein n=1 Tax=Ophiocordyceps polyrhachis-furcata BCC 54312 TaxID=1330021 RepID=A0A367L8G8_9HYPO|nr:hypothetical protein L249_5170 [Ophiocordyceps polyrhachis-furcata BCC 54312]
MAESSGQSSITVAVRVRPFTIREAAQLQRTDDSTVFLGDGSLAGAPTPKLHQRGLRSVIKVVDDRCLVFDPPEDNPVQRFSRSVIPTSKKVKDQVFAFDRVFDENTTQADVYEGTTRNLLDSVLDGYNATVFAYGATGCGKTHTITGTAQQPGIIFLTMQELFEKMEDRSQEKTTELTLSYLEIYNETIRDLLVPGGSKQGLMLREDSNQAVTVTGLTSHHPRDVQEVMDMIVQGNEYRTVSPTEANATSSRSHAVLQINVSQKDRNADVSEPHTMATLSIIDLAGSERASVTKNRGERLTEGANINKSLLALGSCINALCDRRQRAHVPYRNSKLTRLLKFSLGGNCKTVMIVCVSPSSAHFDETQNTLRYANRAKNIQTKVTRNVFNVNRHVKDFLVKIDEQMALINELKAQQRDAETVFFAKFRRQGEKREAVAREGLQRLRAAYENAAGLRAERVTTMKKLRALERRIGMLTTWIAAFDAVSGSPSLPSSSSSSFCSSASSSDDETTMKTNRTMPQPLIAVRKTARGILAELEHSRQHLHQKLDRTAWDRALDSALAHSLKQLETADGGVGSASTALEREAELLRAKFEREACLDVLEQERTGGDMTAMMQSLLTAQLDMLASLAEMLSMDEASAVARARKIINDLLQTGYEAASRVVKPDGSLPTPASAEAFPPTRKGTPKRKKTAATLLVRPVANSEHVMASPMKSSPRRRRAAKKGVSFTPVKRAKSRGVRWRDDETEEGTLADFEKTPQKVVESSPERPSSPEGKKKKKKRTMEVQEEETSTTTTTTTTTTTPPSATKTAAAASRPGRFQDGFLSKSSRATSGSGQQQGGSPLLTPPVLSLSLASSSPEPSSPALQPLRSLDVGKAGNRSPPVARTRFFSPRLPRPATAMATTTTAGDENTPLQTTETGSDSEPNIDPRKLRNAMDRAKKDKARRASVSAASNNSRRVSSMGPGAGSIRAPPPPPASSANGISRHHRRVSPDRRRSPPLTCSPPELKGAADRSFTVGQARRMNLGGGSAALRPDDGLESGGETTRRVTIGVGAAAARRQESRMATTWR